MKMVHHNDKVLDLLALLGSRWGMCILDTLTDGPMRFMDFEKKLGATHKATSEALKELMVFDLVEKNKDSAYQLTAKARAVSDIVRQIGELYEPMEQVITVKA